MDGKETVYISGPMRGYEDYNFPAFDRAAAAYHEMGCNVISPPDLDRAQGLDESTPCSEINMRVLAKRDLDALLTADTIYMLRGWEKSVGARAEHAVAIFAGIDVEYE